MAGNRLILGLMALALAWPMPRLQSQNPAQIRKGADPAECKQPAREPNKPGDFLLMGHGQIPVILSAPHGGRKEIPGVMERVGTGVEKFARVTDTGTLEFLELLVVAVEKEFGGKPHFVGARFARKYIDANRPAKDAFESEIARPFYDEYHRHLAEAVAMVKRINGRGILLDIHGQAKEPQTLFRGTAKKSTVSHLLDRFGQEALTGPKSILGVLEKEGYRVFPAGDSKEPEEPGYNGGFIVQQYGSRQSGTIDAIQFELGSDFRSRTRRDKFARDLARAIKIYADSYLKKD